MSETQHILSPSVHRVVQADGRRFSLKLEPTYWRILGDEAKRQEISVGRLIQGIEKDLPEEASLTAAVRLYCIELLLPSEPHQEDHESESDRQRNIKILTEFFRAAPTPGLLLDEKEHVVAVNDAFEKWSNLRGDSLVRKPVGWHLQLRMPEPMPAILRKFGERYGGRMACRVSYVSPGRIIVANGCACLVRWSAPDDYLWGVWINGGENAVPPAR